MSAKDRGPAFLEKAIECIEFYSKNPIIAAEDLLFVELDTAQKIVLEDMWFRPFVLVTACRGFGKSFLLSVICALYAMLNPGKRVLIMSPSLRQSKGVFEELKKRWTESPILREASEKRPIIGPDKCYLDLRGTENRPGSSIEAYPLGVGDKIRGLRGHLIVADELAKIPGEIYDAVIRPMGATTSSPMENVKKVKRLRAQYDRGILSTEEFELEMEEFAINKLIGVSSAQFKFNHMYPRIEAYEGKINSGSKKFAVHYFSHYDLSEGFLDKHNVEEAQATMSRIEFSMEYLGIWQSDSDGFFKASLIEKSKSRDAVIKLKGDPNKKYIIGVDPARSSDAFAVVVVEIDIPYSSVVFATQATSKAFPWMANFLFDIANTYNTVVIVMDAGSGGGGVALKDILSNEQFFKKDRILDMEDEEHKNLDGRHILRMNVPNPKNNSDNNFAALALLEQEKLKFPHPPMDGDIEKENAFSHVEEMLKQTTLITMTQTKSGVAHFDIPSSGKGSRKKDLYSAFILAAKGLYDIIGKHTEDNSFVNKGGLVIPTARMKEAPMISSITKVPGLR